MPKSKRKDSIPNQQSINPTVCVLSSGPKREMNCNYDNVTFVFAEEHEVSAPQLFNNYLNFRNNFDAFLYMDKNYDFANSDSLSRLVNLLFSEEMEGINGLYTDINARVHGRQALLKSYPFAGKAVLQLNKIINIPFIVKSFAAPTFDERFGILCLHNGINQIFDNSIIFHAPFSAFTINNFVEISDKMALELKILEDDNK